MNERSMRVDPDEFGPSKNPANVGLPEGLFTKSQGKFYFYLSTEETPGTQDVTVTISSIDYTCLIVELI